MTDADVPIVFPGGGKKKKKRMKWEKNELKCFSCNSMQHELFLSSINMSQSMPLCLKQGFEDVTFETSPDLLYIGFNSIVVTLLEVPVAE